MRMTPSTLQCSLTPLSVLEYCGSSALAKAAWSRVKPRAVCCIVSPQMIAATALSLCLEKRLTADGEGMEEEEDTESRREESVEQLVVVSTENQGDRGRQMRETSETTRAQ